MWPVGMPCMPHAPKMPWKFWKMMLKPLDMGCNSSRFSGKNRPNEESCGSMFLYMSCVFLWYIISTAVVSKPWSNISRPGYEKTSGWGSMVIGHCDMIIMVFKSSKTQEDFWPSCHVPGAFCPYVPVDFLGAPRGPKGDQALARVDEIPWINGHDSGTDWLEVPIPYRRPIF